MTGRRRQVNDRQVRCSTCRQQVPWPDEAPLYRYKGGKFIEEITSHIGDGPTRSDVEMTLHRMCPNPLDMGVHYLPARYYEYGEPLVIGLVGGSGAGKTHLITSMVAALLRPNDLGLDVQVMDQRRHDIFVAQNLEPLFGTPADPDRADQLDGTPTGIWEAIEVLLVRGADGRLRPVSVFDAAGGDLKRGDGGIAGQFLVGLNALLFVQPVGDPADVTPDQSTITQALSRLSSIPDLATLPAAVAVTKADRLRYEPVVDRWLRQPATATVDPARVHAESRDVYAFLRQQGHFAATEPYRVFRRCTLHFTSGTGREARNNRYARGVAPMRILEPLLALFAMAGVLPGGAEVGT